MMIWGLMVTGLLVLGCLPMLVGLIVIMPVLGHATWHLYRKVVGYFKTTVYNAPQALVRNPKIAVAQSLSKPVATHLGNGMRPPHHREPGPVIGLLDSPSVTCELVADGAKVVVTGRSCCVASFSSRTPLLAMLHWLAGVFAA